MSKEEYAPVVALAQRCIDEEPALVIDALCDRMNDLAAQERFEEAGATRDRMNAFSEAMKRQRLLNRLRDTERLVIEDHLGHRFEFQRGQLIEYCLPDDGSLVLSRTALSRTVEARPKDPGPVSAGPLDRELADELLLIGRWLDRNASDVRVVHVEGLLSSTATPVPVPGRSPGRPG